MRQQRIIWFAIFSSTVIYLVMAYWMAPVPPRPFEQSVRNMVTLVMYGMAVAVFIAAMVVPSHKQSPPSQKMIMALAMFESCAIFGLLAAFMQHDWRLYVPTWIVALIGFMREFPSNEVSSPAA